MRRTFSLDQRSPLWGYLFAAPSLLGFVIFFGLPVLASLYFSFTEYDILTPPHWVGLSNYVTVFHDTYFWRAGLNVVLWALGTIPAGIIIGVTVAYLLNQNIRGKQIYQVLYYLPVVSMSVAVLVLWKWIYQPDFGLLNTLLGKLGIGRFNWLGTSGLALASVMVVSLWKSASYYMVIFLAGLQAIPKEYYEAAQLDGASGWVQFWRLTLPLLTPTIFFVLTLTLIASFQVFDEIYVMTRGGPFRSTETFVYHIWMNAFKVFKMGYASSQAWVLFILVGTFTLLNFRFQRRWVHYE